VRSKAPAFFVERTFWFIQPTSWKGDSAKFICRILHSFGPIAPKNRRDPDPLQEGVPKMLWD
jgi:hypothetical protein